MLIYLMFLSKNYFMNCLKSQSYKIKSQNILYITTYKNIFDEHYS